MAINNGIGGGHTFDPSKRIRAKLGEDFVQSVESEAIDRLAEAMATTATKTTPINETEEKNDMSLRDMFGRIQHTTPRAAELKEQNAEKVEAKLQEFEREDAEIGDHAAPIIETETISTPNPSKLETVVRATTGIGIKDSKKHNFDSIVRNTIRAGGSLVTTDVMETTFRMNRYNENALKNIGIATGVSTAIDFAVTAFTTPSSTRVMKLMADTGVGQYRNLSLEDANKIKKVARKEGMIYAAEHAVAGVVLPAAIKFGLSKFVGDDKLESSKLLKVATSFGTISTATKVGLTAIRNLTSKKIPENPASMAQVAKVAANVAINEQIDSTLIGTVAGSIIGYNSVYYKYPTNETTENKLAALKEHAAVPVVGETVVVPVEKTVKASKPETKTTKSSATKVVA